MPPDDALQLYDPRNGDLSLRVEPFSSSSPAVPQRSNYFTVYWLEQGSGVFCADSGQHPFAAQCLLFAVPYQSFRLLHSEPLAGQQLQFHANFLCIETYHEEIGCNGVLFNDTYGVPCVQLDAAQGAEFVQLLSQMRDELRHRGLAQSEVLLAYLKIFLVRATRLKLQQQSLSPLEAPSVRPEILTELQRLLELHFRTHHSPAHYAALLHISPKALARLVKTHLHKTLTELIRDRLLRQAKWELLHTRQPVKQVAVDLGFTDIFYFSRLFKRATGCSPTYFREFETAIRGGRNLSMP